MTNKKYNFDDKFSIKNKLTGNGFINDVTNKKLILKKPVTGDKQVIAQFCITDLTWNDSNKDIDKITISSASGSNDYDLSSNATAVKNRIFKEAYPNGGQVLPSSLDKKFMTFGVNDLLYEFIQLVVMKIQDNTLPVGLETVTLSVSAADTAELVNGCITITAKDESNTAIKGLDIVGTIGDEIEIDGTTDDNGQVSTQVTTAGEYTVTAGSEATTEYKSATVTETVTVTDVQVVENNEGEGGTE